MEEPGTLIKFGCQAHLLLLQEEGLLYMNPPSYFQKIEDEELRGDPLDCVGEVARGHKVGLTLADGKELFMVGNWTLTINLREQKEMNLFCMYALRPLLESTFPVDQRMFRFGEYALVITNRDEFMRRIEASFATQKMEYRGALVEYVDDCYAGKLGPFKKLQRFAYQSEWRLVCYGGAGGPREIRIGTIRDIAVVMRASEVNTSIRIDRATDHNEKPGATTGDTSHDTTGLSTP